MRVHLKKYTGIISFSVLLVILGITLNILNTNRNKTTQLRTSAQEPGPTIPGIVAGITSIPTATEPSVTPNLSSHSPIYLGMWTEGFWEEATFHLRPEKLTELENAIGKKAAIAHYYRGWENLGQASIVDELRLIDSHGWRPMLSVNPYFFDRCLSNGMPLYKAIASGNCDSFMREASRNLKTFGKPVFLRFAWEMNIDSIEWNVKKTGSSTEDFIGAWRRFHDIAVSEGASNILWVFSPNVETPQSIPYNELYPGDGYVDWMGLDGYNWGTTQSWSSWQSFGTVFGSSYQSLLALSPSKPIMIAEVNTTDHGGDKASWYRDMLVREIPNNFPQIKAVVFYNEDRTAKEHVNWLITISPASLNAFSESIKNPMYLSSF